jgi:hypothetical protein
MVEGGTPMRHLTLIGVIAVSSATAWSQVPAGGEFQVNSYTTNRQGNPDIGLADSGRFTIVWDSDDQDGSYLGVFAQSYEPDGARLGDEFRVNGATSLAQQDPTVAIGRRGETFVVWQGVGEDLFDIFAQRYDGAGRPAGAEFRVNTITSGQQYRSDVAARTSGDFVVSWSSHSPSPSFNRIVAQRYDADGLPRGGELVVAGAPSQGTNFPAIAAGPDATFVVVWKQFPLVGGARIVGRRFDGAGTPWGAEFQASVSNDVYFGFPSVDIAADGSFVVVWEHGSAYGGAMDIRGRRFSSAGSAIGGEFAVSATGPANHREPSVAADDVGNFVVSWTAGGPGGYDAFVRRFDATGAPRSGEVRVNTYTSGVQFAARIAGDATGNFVVVWATEGEDGSSTGISAQRFGGLLPAAAAVDGSPTPQSDGNGVLEPGEEVELRTTWRNISGGGRTFGGMLARLTGPAGAGYAVADPTADFGAVPDDGTAACADCYALSVSAPSVRPVSHWDVRAVESITPDALGNQQAWALHVGDSFTDVPRSRPFYRFVETLFHRGATAGCAATAFCPQAPTTREQMAALILAALEGPGYTPPACAFPPFDDVPASSPFCPFVAELARRGVVAGCGGTRYCPTDPVAREQVPVFVLRALDPALDPPACATPLFEDVPAGSPFCPWIEELARRGVVTGCRGGHFCPADPVTREQVSVFAGAGFGLVLYGR